MVEFPEDTEDVRPPRTSRDYYREGLALGREGRHEDALSTFSLALSDNPGHALAWVGSGFALGKLGRYDEEIECCEKAIFIDPNCVEAWNFKGFALGMLGRFEDKL